MIFNRCRIIDHKDDACIICGPNFLPPSLRRNMNQLNAFNDDKTNNPPIQCNSQSPADHFKPCTSPPKISPMVSAIMGRLNNIEIGNGDVEVQPLEFTFDSDSESVPDPYANPIKSIDDDEMDHILQFFHSEHDDDLLDVDLHMLQD